MDSIDNTSATKAMKIMAFLAIISNFILDMVFVVCASYYLVCPFVFWIFVGIYLFMCGLKSPSKMVTSALTHLFNKLNSLCKISALTSVTDSRWPGYLWQMCQVVLNTYRRYYPSQTQQNTANRCAASPPKTLQSTSKIRSTMNIYAIGQGEKGFEGSLSYQFRRFHNSVFANTPEENREGRRLKKQKLAMLAKNPYMPLHYTQQSSCSALADRIRRFHGPINYMVPISNTLDTPTQSQSEKRQPSGSPQQSPHSEHLVRNKLDNYKEPDRIIDHAHETEDRSNTIGKFTAPSEAGSSGTDIYGCSDDNCAPSRTLFASNDTPLKLNPTDLSVFRCSVFDGGCGQRGQTQASDCFQQTEPQTEPMDIVDEVGELGADLSALSIDDSHEIDYETYQTTIIPRSAELNMDDAQEPSDPMDIVDGMTSLTIRL